MRPSAKPTRLVVRVRSPETCTSAQLDRLRSLESRSWRGETPRSRRRCQRRWQRPGRSRTTPWFETARGRRSRSRPAAHPAPNARGSSMTSRRSISESTASDRRADLMPRPFGLLGDQAWVPLACSQRETRRPLAPRPSMSRRTAPSSSSIRSIGDWRRICGRRQRRATSPFRSREARGMSRSEPRRHLRARRCRKLTGRPRDYAGQLFPHGDPGCRSGADMLRTGPAGAYVHGFPGDLWLPVGPARRSALATAQSAGADVGRSVSGGGQVVVRGTASSALLALVRGDRVLAAWRVTSATPLGEIQLAEPFGDGSSPLSACGRRIERSSLRLL